MPESKGFEDNKPTQSTAIGSPTFAYTSEKVVDLATFRERDQQTSVMPNELAPTYAATAATDIFSQGAAMVDLTREEMKAEIAASEARGETKIARIEGKLDLVIAKLDHVTTTNAAIQQNILESKRAVMANAWVIFAAIVALVVGFITLIPSFLDWGSKIRDMVHNEVNDQTHPGTHK